ncbi:MAG: sigma-70 family RNA polymerase sigma factor [Deltaproteobacteria bacterium]|nr:MAG: sigma-70 family RNA polymerase sigma factor [Deltaproteobacteria bacterium]
MTAPSLQEASPSRPDEGADALWARWAAMRSRAVAHLVTQGWSEPDAEDLFGQALLRAWERRDALTDEAAAEGWFWTLMRRLAVDVGRSVARQDRRRAPDAELDRLAEPVDDTETCACSLRLLAGLEETSRELVEAVDLRGEAVYAAASQLGLSANAASARLFRARRMLRRRLREQCRTTSAAECLDCGCPP